MHRRPQISTRTDPLFPSTTLVRAWKAFGIAPGSAPDLSRWTEIVERLESPEGEVTIGVVGQYVGLQDAYKSLNEAHVHGGIANRVKVNTRWIEAELFEARARDIAQKLDPLHANPVPGDRQSVVRGKTVSIREDPG